MLTISCTGFPDARGLEEAGFECAAEARCEAGTDGSPCPAAARAREYAGS